MILAIKMTDVSRSRTKPKKKKVYVLAEDDDEDDDEFNDDLSAPQPLAHQTSPNFPHYGMPPPTSPYYQSPNPYYPQPGPYYSPKVSYAKPRKSYDRKKLLQRYSLIQIIHTSHFLALKH